MFRKVHAGLSTEGTAIELILHPYEHQGKSLIAGGIQRLRESFSTHSRRGTTTLQTEDDEMKTLIPLSCLFENPIPKGATPQITGNFFISKQAVLKGEISIHVIASPSLFSCSHTMSLNVKHEQYLTVWQDYHWQRVYGRIQNASIRFSAFHRRQNELNQLDLQNLTQMQVHVASPTGMANVVELSFDSSTKKTASFYADTHEQALQWADAISKAVWNQPFIKA